MIDPTFTRHFGMAVQSDILREASRDRQWRQERSEQQPESRVWLRAVVRLLDIVLWPYTSRRRPHRSERAAAVRERSESGARA